MTTDYKHGIPRTSALGSIVAAATAITVVPRIGTRTMKIRKVAIMNHVAANGVVRIGTGLGGGFVSSIPEITIVSGMDLQLGPDMLPDVEFIADITAQTSVAAAAAPNDVQIEITVEEYP